MAKTVFAKKLDLIQAEAHNFLNQFGYREKGRTFTKSLDSGLIHVINFQMGKNYHFQTGKSPLAGKFTINLGVFIPEIYRAIWDKEATNITHGNCEITKRIGLLASSPKDLWWDLKKNKRKLSKNVLMHLDKYGLPYLNQFNTQEDIILEWYEHGESIGLPPRAGLSIAILLANSGNHKEARRLLISEYKNNIERPYAENVIRISKRIGISLETNE
jgi:hypothetical protein